MKFPRRKKIRLENYDYSQNGVYYVTLCTANREPLLWDNPKQRVILPNTPRLSPMGQMTKTAICNVSAVYPNVSVEKYAIMPDHVHLMLFLQDGTRPLPTIIRGIKTVVSKQCGHTIWQKSYYEHVIRTDAEFLAIWKYIDENPMALYCDK